MAGSQLYDQLKEGQDLSNSPIHYDTKSDRELLIVVAESINNLSRNMETVCVKVEEHEKSLEANKDKIREHDLTLASIVKDTARVALETTKTLGQIQEVMVIHTDKLSKMEPIVKTFWWIIGVLGTALAGSITYLLKQLGFFPGE